MSGFPCVISVPWLRLATVGCFNSVFTTLQGANVRCHGDAVQEAVLFLCKANMWDGYNNGFCLMLACRPNYCVVNVCPVIPGSHPSTRRSHVTWCCVSQRLRTVILCVLYPRVEVHNILVACCNHYLLVFIKVSDCAELYWLTMLAMTGYLFTSV